MLFQIFLVFPHFLLARTKGGRTRTNKTWISEWLIQGQFMPVVSDSLANYPFLTSRKTCKLRSANGRN